MIKTSQFFPFRFPLTRIRACFSVRTSPPFLSAEKTFHRLFYLLYLIPPLSSSSPSSVVFCFCFVLHFLSLPPLSFFSSRILSLSTLLPPPFFSNLSARCVYTTLDTTQSIEKLFSSHNLPHPCSPRPSPTPRWRAARCRISVTLFRALISRYISPVYVERNTESPDIQVTRRFPFFFFLSSSAIFITPAPSILSDSFTVVCIYIG